MMMRSNTLLDTAPRILSCAPEQTLRKVYFFHDVRIICQTNHAAILAILDDLLGIFPEVAGQALRGEVNYSVFCYESTEQFPTGVPHDRVRTDTVRLLTQTKLKYYRSGDATMEYQRYKAHPPVNGAALTVISAKERMALTQLEMPEQYSSTFLRRYVFLMALGQLVRPYGFEPCHAAAVSAPWNRQQGALIIGASGSGKTTLSLGCACTGYGLLGDDLVMLRQQETSREINAYAISHEVSVRSSSIDLWPNLAFLRTFPVDQRDKRYCTIEQVRSGATCLQVPIRLLLFPSLSTAKETVVTPMSKASTLQALVEACLSNKDMYRQAQEQFFFLLSSLVEQASGYRLSIAQGANDGPEIVRLLFAQGGSS